MIGEPGDWEREASTIETLCLIIKVKLLTKVKKYLIFGRNF